MVAAAGIERTHLVLDLGAGTGSLTRPLGRTGARVIAVELHPGRARVLRGIGPGDIKVVEEDAALMSLPRSPFRVVANPPFSASTSIIKHLTRRGSSLIRADLVLPWYVTRRWVGSSSHDWEFSPGLRLPRAAFVPPGKGDTQVLRIIRAPRRGHRG